VHLKLTSFFRRELETCIPSTELESAGGGEGSYIKKRGVVKSRLRGLVGTDSFYLVLKAVTKENP